VFRFKIVLIFLLLSTKAFSQSFLIESKVDTDSIKVGEEIRYEFSFALDSIETLNFKLQKINLPFEILEEYDFDTILTNNKYRLIKKYSITSFEPGSFPLIAPLNINNQILRTKDSIIINVSNVKVDTVSKKFFDIKNIIAVEKNTEGWWKKYFIVISIGLMVFLLIIIFRQSNWFKDSKEEIIPPLEQAIKALKFLELTEKNNKQNYKLYYSKLTEIVKSYYEKEVKVDAIESTTNELLNKLELLKDSGKLDIGKETLNNFKSVLNNADLVKFAKSNPGLDTAVQDKKLVKSILIDTKKAIPKPTEEELLKSEIYQLKLKEENRQKLFKKGLKWFGVFFGISVIGLISIFGLQSTKDFIIGNDTKDLLNKQNWIESSYGAYPINLVTPDVLKRSKSDSGQLFEFQNLDYPVYISVFTKPFSEDEDYQALILNNLKSKKGSNILTQVEEFLTEEGVKSLKFFGSFDYENNEQENVKKEYMSLVFSENGGLQVVTFVMDRNNKYASSIYERIEKSIEFKKL
jgi:hypothetical protein